MSNFNKTRTAHFKGVTNPTRVEIILSHAIPLISHSITAGYGVNEYNLSVSSVDLDSAEPLVFPTKLTYFDDDGVEDATRFKFIAIIPSVITKGRGFLYYDRDNKDLFLN